MQRGNIVCRVSNWNFFAFGSGSGSSLSGSVPVRFRSTILFRFEPVQTGSNGFREKKAGVFFVFNFFSAAFSLQCNGIKTNSYCKFLCANVLILTIQKDPAILFSIFSKSQMLPERSKEHVQY